MSLDQTTKIRAAKTAVAYLRVSTSEQAEEGVSLEAQDRAVKSYCSLRGLDLLKVITDAAVSGAKRLDSRDGGSELLKLAKQRQATHVVALRLDRLFRSAVDALQTATAWDRQGVALHLIDLGGQPVDTSTAIGKFFLTVMAGAAEMERNLISERTKAGLAVLRDRGEYIGTLPYGFALDEQNSRLVPNQEELKALKRMRQLRKRGLSLRKVVARLNEESVPARGQRWHLGTVARLLAQKA